MTLENRKHRMSDFLIDEKLQTRVSKKLLNTFIYTCDPNLIDEIYKDSNYVRSDMSRRMLEQTGAVDAMVSQEESVAKLKRDEMKKFLNNELYRNILNKIMEELNQNLHTNIGKNVDLYPILLESVSRSFFIEFLGIEYNGEFDNIRNTGKTFKQELLNEKRKMLNVKVHTALNIFPLPLWFRNLFYSRLKERNKQFQKRVESIYKTAKFKPGSWIERLKQLESEKLLTKKDVLGEIRTIYISAVTLSSTVVWTMYRLMVEDPIHLKKTLENGNYARYCYMESMRLNPPFEVLSYEKKSKCPFHRNNIYLFNLNGVHKNPLYWNYPDVFKPNRFESGSSAIKKGSYIPFGGTDRFCIGNALSMYIAPKMIKEIFTKYRFVVDNNNVNNLEKDLSNNNTFFVTIMESK